MLKKLSKRGGVTSGSGHPGPSSGGRGLRGMVALRSHRVTALRIRHRKTTREHRPAT